MQCYNAVAAVGRLIVKNVGGRVRAGGVGLAIPSETVTCGYGFNTLCWYAVSHKNDGLQWIASTSVGDANHRVGGGGMRRQCHAGGAVTSGPHETVGATCRECGALVQVYGNVACDGDGRDGAYGEMERIHLGTPVGIKMGIGVIPTGSIGGAVPAEFPTFVGRESRVLGSVDGQVQDCDTVASLHCLEILAVVSRGEVFIPIPTVAVASGRRPFLNCGMIYGQMQCHDAVATGDGAARDCIGGDRRAGIIGLAVPNKAVTSGNGFNALSGVAWFYDNGDGDGLAGATVGGAGDGIGGGTGG